MIETKKNNYGLTVEDREVNYKNRATFDDLTDLDKKSMGFLDY